MSGGNGAHSVHSVLDVHGVLDLARDWIAGDPDAGDREELSALVAAVESGGVEGGGAAALDELVDRMSGMLTFGTAGLRGRMGAGPNRMNTAVVTTATAGLCAVLSEVVGPDFTVVVGYDGRHRSPEFARTVAGVVVAAGGRARLMPGPLPTPLLVFAMGGADAGVMITASHNPSPDSGYKLYLGERAAGPEGAGIQIVPPMDARIEDAIRAAGPAASIPVADSGWEVLGDEVVDEYVAATASTVREAGPLRIVLTALHGVGADVALRTLAAAGFTDVTPVAEQCDPDPDFPTVEFPNPEEPGALDLAVATARRVGADVIVALDPDADRCAVAVPGVSVPDAAVPDAAVPDAAVPGVSVPAGGGWRQLTGDEVGALLGDMAASAHEGDEDANLAGSIVSTSLVGRIAAAHGLGYAETLTGFKWIARTPNLVFGFEEAIGYCVNPGVVRDKDGISAGLKVCELAASLKRRGRTLADRLDDLAVEHGLYVTSPLPFWVDAPAAATAALERLRENPPRTLAWASVTAFDDLAEGFRGLPPTEGVRMETDAGDRVVVRPSGTEPKLKCYLQVVSGVASRWELIGARERARKRLDRIKEDLRAAIGL